MILERTCYDQLKHTSVILFISHRILFQPHEPFHLDSIAAAQRYATQIPGYCNQSDVNFAAQLSWLPLCREAEMIEAMDIYSRNRENDNRCKGCHACCEEVRNSIASFLVKTFTN